MKIADSLFTSHASLSLVLDAEQTDRGQTDGLKALMNIIYRQPARARPPSVASVLRSACRRLYAHK